MTRPAGRGRTNPFEAFMRAIVPDAGRVAISVTTSDPCETAMPGARPCSRGWVRTLGASRSEPRPAPRLRRHGRRSCRRRFSPWPRRTVLSSPCDREPRESLIVARDEPSADVIETSRESSIPRPSSTCRAVPSRRGPSVRSSFASAHNASRLPTSLLVARVDVLDVTDVDGDGHPVWGIESDLSWASQIPARRAGSPP